MTDPKYVCPFEILEIIYVMATQGISQEANNYVRLDLAIKDTCTECLREVLNKCVPVIFQDINHALQFLEPRLKQHLESYKYSQLFSNHQLRANFSISECDMSLVYSLIRNSNWIPSPTGGWGTYFTNSPQDKSLGANVERLHLFRNKLEHCKEPSISNQDFNNYWTEVRKCVADIETSLGSTTYQQSLDCLRIKDLDPDYANRIINEFGDAVRGLQAEQCRQSDYLHEIRVNQSGHGSTLSDITNSLNEQSKYLSDLKTKECKQSKLLHDLAVKNEQQYQLLQNDRKVLSDIKTSHDHLDLSIGEALDALKDQDTGLVRIAKEQNNQTISLQSLEKKLEEMHEKQSLLLNNNKESLEKIQEIVESREQCEAGCEGIQRLSLEDLENSDRINQRCMTDGKSEEVSCTDSMNIRNQHQNEADNKGSLNNAMNCDMSRENDISIAADPDGFICLRKQYVYIKSNLLKKEAVEIAKCLLKDELITNDEYETITDLKRKPCVDTLLKKIILGDADQLVTFSRSLKSVNLKVFRELEATKVTDEDRSRFKQVEERALKVTNASGQSDSETILDDSDILFFQNRLSASREVVDSINDAMLVRFKFSVRDHSNVLECKKSDPKIRKLCETMNLCDMDVENELKTLLRAILYKEWMEFRKKKGNHVRQQYLRWLNAPVTLVRFMFRTLGFIEAVEGCIILKFSTGDGFDITSLTREFVQENVTDLLWKGYLETQINIKNPVHVTVFIMSPSNNGNDEIHFYLDFDTADDRTRGEDHEQEIADQERLFLLEQLDLIELTEWIMNQPDMQKTTKHMLEDKLSRSDMSRNEELNVLLDSIYVLKNGRELIERFCKENDPDVYNSLFATTDQDSSEKHKSLVEKPLQYERGRGLQRLYSFWMDINADQKEPHISYLHSDSSEFNPAYNIKQTENEFMEPTVRKCGYTTIVLQVGKLDEIWSDAMVIFGKGWNSPDLPRTIIEKIGPQIQREFKEKYPNGLGKKEVAVLSGFNLPVWKIFYFEHTCDAMKRCYKMAVKLKMRSILFLVQEEHFVISLRFPFFECYYYFGESSISTIYFHVDQDTLEWKKLRKIAEDELLTEIDYFIDFSADYTVLSANPEPKVFSVGPMTVIIKVGKLEEIKSDALVIFEVANEQWPTQNLPSEILEKIGPMIQKEFKEKFPAGLEYAKVAVLNGYNLPCRKILFGVLPRWQVAWLKQAIEVFLTECVQLASDEGITSIAFMIPSVPYHVAEMYASVLHSCFEMRIFDKPSCSISMQNIVIKDGCTGANMLKMVFEEEWAHRIVFKEGRVTVVNRVILLEEILMKRGKGTQTCAILSEEPDSKALVIVSKLEDIIAILEEISPSLEVEFRTKYPYALPEEEVVILDGYNNPFKKIYCSNYISTFEVTDIIVKCFHMAENDKMNSIFLRSNPKWIMSKRLAQCSILGLRIFVIENPSSSIRRLYLNSEILREEISDVTSFKVFKERHVTVVLNAIYSQSEYIFRVPAIYGGTPANKDMDMFFNECIQEADESGVPSVTFSVPNIVESIKLFASALITCVKRFARNTPSSSIKRIYIRIDMHNPGFQETKRVFEEEWAMISGEETPEVLSQQIDEPHEKQGGKQGYLSEDIYLKKTLSISKLPEKSKEGFTIVPEEDVD